MKNLKRVLKNSKKNKIVFTNGFFDCLHPGHLYLLKRAKRFGDFLIVGLNSDRSIKKLNKPFSRPIYKQDIRKKMLESVRWVDKVIIFDEENPEKLIKRIKPDVLVKGGDYREKTIVGASFVKSYGGKVKVIPLYNHFSTTNLIKKIKKL